MFDSADVPLRVSAHAALGDVLFALADPRLSSPTGPPVNLAAPAQDLAPLLARLDALDARLQALEAEVAILRRWTGYDLWGWLQRQWRRLWP